MTQPREPARCSNCRSPMWFLLAQALWAVTFVGATWLIKNEKVTEGPMAWLVAAAPALAAIIACVAWVRHIKGSDEMQRAIQLRALAIAVAVGFVAIPSYSLMNHLGVNFGGWSDAPFLLMVFAYCAATIRGHMVMS